MDVKFLTFKGKRGEKIRRFQFTAIDDATRVRALKIYEKHTQVSAIDFVDHVIKSFPFRIREIRTDNQRSPASFPALLGLTIGLYSYILKGTEQERSMAGRQAKFITDSMLRRILAHIRRSPTPDRDQVIILLSTKAGLRACEIAGLEWSMVLDPRGKIGSSLMIEDRIAKRGSGRRIPLNVDLKSALTQLRRSSPRDGPVIQSGRGGAMNSNSIVNWFVTLFKELNFKGCSSHSGRRTFITNAARNSHRAGGCLRDVQLLAGHQSLAVTQRYIDGDTNAQRRLVSMV